jgi:hypothetical protein
MLTHGTECNFLTLWPRAGRSPAMQPTDSAAAAAAALVVLCSTACYRSTHRVPEPEPEPEPQSGLQLKPSPSPEAPRSPVPSPARAAAAQEPPPPGWSETETETAVPVAAPFERESESRTIAVEPAPQSATTLLELDSDPAPEPEPGCLQSPRRIHVHQQFASTYLPLPAAAPRSKHSQPISSNQSGSTAAARRLRASRAGRISTANYRPLPPTAPSTTTEVQNRHRAAAFRPYCDNEQGQPQPHRVRFGDILGFHCNGGQLAALDPTQQAQPAATSTWACPQWEIAMRSDVTNGDGDGPEGGEFEVHPSWEWSKQRAFSGAARQVSVG